jgi:hypothetical protein
MNDERCVEMHDARRRFFARSVIVSIVRVHIHFNRHILQTMPKDWGGSCKNSGRPRLNELPPPPGQPRLSFAPAPTGPRVRESITVEDASQNRLRAELVAQQHETARQRLSWLMFEKQLGRQKKRKLLKCDVFLPKRCERRVLLVKVANSKQRDWGRLAVGKGKSLIRLKEV